MRPIGLVIAFACACGHPHTDNPGDDVDGGVDPTGDATPPSDAAVTPTGTGMWQGRGAGTDISMVYALASDTDGSVVAVGLFKGSVDFGAGYMASRGGQDFFVVKYAADGTVRWSRRLGGCGDESYPAVAIGADHAVFVAGVALYLGTQQCDPFFANARIPTSIATGFPVIVARYDADGGETWARAYGPNSANMSRVAVAARGDVVAVVADTATSIDFGNSVTVGGSCGSYCTFMAVVAASDGTARWAKPIGAQGWLDVKSVAIDDDQLVIAGNTNTTIDVGAPQTLVGFGSGDAILAAYRLTDGAYRWDQHLGGPGDDQVTAISRARDGSFWIAGAFTQPAHFGGGVLTPSGSHYSGYAAHFTAGGDPLGSFVTDSVYSTNLGVAPFDDGVIVVGDHMPTSSTAPATAMRFDGAGTALWREELGGTYSTAMAAVTGPHAEIVVAGGFTNTLTVPGLATLHSSSTMHSYPDAFVVRVAP